MANTLSTTVNEFDIDIFFFEKGILPTVPLVSLGKMLFALCFIEI